MLQARRNWRWVAVTAVGCGFLVLLSGTAVAATPESSPPGLAAEPASSATDITSDRNMKLVYRGLASWGSDTAVRRRALALPTAHLRELQDPSWDSRIEARRLFRHHRALRSVRYGLGFDYLLGQAMALHLDLHQRRKSKKAGLRIRPNGDAPVAVEYHRRVSLGAAIDPVRTEDGERLIRWVPQLRVNLDGKVGAHCRGLVEYGYWRGGDKYVTTDEQVLQASLKMTF